MSRWHKPYCTAPDVISSGEVPHCRKCDSHCPLEELASAQTGDSPLTFPPNETCGQLDLWWPRCVPYTSSGTKERPLQPMAQTNLPSNHQTKLRDNNTEPLAFMTSKPVTLDEPVHLPVYGPMLGADEFRLVCLTPPRDAEDEIVHLSLEIYSFTNCPEYETVSYTWGGENGDYTLCRPIFIGPFWDVVFQTQNCWDMLRSIRPWRGIRMVWVDAICINQRNNEERGAQVAKMGQIYQQCLRVIVYLGADIVSSTSNRFPSRHPLHKIESDAVHPLLPNGSLIRKSKIDMKELLKRKYFQRVWVIQELILSRQAIIRIGDVDFYSDSTGSALFKAVKPKAWHWKSTVAPWVQYMTQKAFPTSDIYQVLRLTSQSRGSDIRDRLFAVLGLIEGDDLHNQIWKPDYSLSAQHVYIGLFAHLIINLKMHHIFQHAIGLSTSNSMPSWIPDWETQESWQRIFKPPQSDLKGFIQKNIRLGSGCHLWQMTNRPSSSGARWVFSEDMEDIILRKRRWNHSSTVDSHTGMLSINLLHLSMITFRPKITQACGKLDIFQAKGGNTSLYLAAEGHLECASCSGTDHLFMLVSEGSPNTYLILREMDETGSYKLVASSTELFLANSGPALLKIESLYNEIEVARCWLDRGLPSQNLTFLRYGMIREQHLEGFFPDMENFRQFMPAYRDYFSASANNFESSLLSCINQEFRPRIVDGFLELSLSSSKFYYIEEYYAWKESFINLNLELAVVHEQSNEHFIAAQTIKNPWEWRRWRNWTPIGLECPSGALFLPRLDLRVPMSTIRYIFKFMLDRMTRIQRVLGIDFDELETLLRDGPGEEHQFIGCLLPNDSHDTDIDLDIRIQRVHIV